MTQLFPKTKTTLKGWIFTTTEKKKIKSRCLRHWMQYQNRSFHRVLSSLKNMHLTCQNVCLEGGDILLLHLWAVVFVKRSTSLLYSQLYCICIINWMLIMRSQPPEISPYVLYFAAAAADLWPELARHRRVLFSPLKNVARVVQRNTQQFLI